MGLFERFPYTNFHELNAGWMLQVMKDLEAAWEQFTAGNSLNFADPLTYTNTKSYAKNTIVLDSIGNAYISLQAVPKGVAPGNQDYWLMVFDYEAFIERVNKNFTGRYYRDDNRAKTPMAVGDWLTLDDVLYKASAPIAVDDLLEEGTNIEAFTLEDFIKAFMQSATQLIQQYKNDIDYSELQFTNNLTTLFNQAVAGVTVDSEILLARVGANGITYPTLADAIQGQFETMTAMDFGTTALTNGDDLDNCTSFTNYVKAPSITVLNGPNFTTATAFNMIVIRNGLDMTVNFMQIILCNNDRHIYTRVHNSNGFGNWMCHASIEDLFDNVKAVTLNGGDDVDTLAPGLYQASNAASLTISNIPHTGGFVLYEIYGNAAKNTALQIIIYGGTNNIHYRFQDSGVWRSWKKPFEYADIFNNDYATTLSGTEDADNLGVGCYVATSAASNTIANIPQTGGFVLYTIYGNAPKNTLVQFIIYGNGAWIYYRFQASGVWSDWVLKTRDFPAYWESDMATKNTAVCSDCCDNGYKTDSFLYVTDLHSPTTYPVIYTLMKYAIDHTPVTKIILGGDEVQTSSIGAYKQLLDDFAPFENVLSVRGNHDTSSADDFYGLVLGRLKDRGIVDGSCDFVYDSIGTKVRYIFLDVADPNNSDMTAGQQTWLTNKINELASGWSCLVITHGLWKSNGTATPTANPIYTTIQSVIDAIYDSCDAQIVGVLTGHAHLDYYETATKGYLMICRTTPSYTQAPSTDPNTPNRTKRTTSEVCFDGVVINTQAGSIKFTRYGSVGSNLSLTYNLKP